MYKPWELARTTFKELLLALEGMQKRDKMHEAWIRRATGLIGSAMGGKSFSTKFDRLWPAEKGPLNISEQAKKQLQYFREAQALKRAKQKLDGGA